MQIGCSFDKPYFNEISLKKRLEKISQEINRLKIKKKEKEFRIVIL